MATVYYVLALLEWVSISDIVGEPVPNGVPNAYDDTSRRGLIYDDNLTYPFNALFWNPSSPLIEGVVFKQTLGSLVKFYRSRTEDLPQDNYECGYTANQQQLPSIVHITLHDGCKCLVKDSKGYYGMNLLSGITIVNSYKVLRIPRADGGYDEYTDFPHTQLL